MKSRVLKEPIAYVKENIKCHPLESVEFSTVNIIEISSDHIIKTHFIEGYNFQFK